MQNRQSEICFGLCLKRLHEKESYRPPPSRMKRRRSATPPFGRLSLTKPFPSRADRFLWRPIILADNKLMTIRYASTIK